MFFQEQHRLKAMMDHLKKTKQSPIVAQVCARRQAVNQISVLIISVSPNWQINQIIPSKMEVYHCIVSSPLDDLCIDVWISVMII